MAEAEQATALVPKGAGIAGLFLGFSYPLRALRLLIAQPGLRPYVGFPILINLILGVSLYAGGLWWGFHQIDRWIVLLPEWAQFVSYLIRAVLGLLLFVVMGLILLQFGGLLGAPFYGRLSEELEALKTGQRQAAAPFKLGSIVYDLWRAIAFELKKLLLLAGVGIPLLICGWLPGVGALIASAGGLTLTTTLVCLDFLDPPLERRRLRFRQKLSIIVRTLPASASFGVLCLALVSIPLVNLLAIPVCITAGTLFFCDRVYSSPNHDPGR
ncbi:MAG: EI24 domain-containing protein [Cyanobacteria bacterium P01_H01_bin.119]